MTNEIIGKSASSEQSLSKNRRNAEDARQH